MTANDRPESRDIPGTGRRVMLHIAAKTVVKDPTAKVPKSAKVSKLDPTNANVGGGKVHNGLFFLGFG